MEHGKESLEQLMISGMWRNGRFTGSQMVPSCETFYCYFCYICSSMFLNDLFVFHIHGSRCVL